MAMNSLFQFLIGKLKEAPAVIVIDSHHLFTILTARSTESVPL